MFLVFQWVHLQPRSLPLRIQKRSSDLYFMSIMWWKRRIPQSPQIVKMTRDLTNTIVNNTSIDPQELKTFLSLQYGARWMKLHPNYLETIPFQNSHNSKICSMVFLIILRCSSSNLYKAGWQRTGVAFVIMFQRYPIPLWS